MYFCSFYFLLKTELEKNIQKWKSTLDELLSKQAEVSSKVAEDKTANSLGVYAISSPDTHKIIYVGKTKTKSIQGRMKDHLQHKHGDTDSDLANMVIKREKLPENYSDYLVRYLSINEPRDRMRFEMFAISVLDPALNKDDNKAPLKRK